MSDIGEQQIEGQLELEVMQGDDEVGRPAVPAPPPPAGEGEAPQLEKVWFRDFKGFSDTTIDLGNFNVLVGVNNAGKSTVLEGVELLFSLLAIHAEGDQLPMGGKLISAEVLPVSQVRDLFHMRQNRRANKYVHATVGASFVDGSSVEFGVRHIFGGANSQVTGELGMAGSPFAGACRQASRLGSKLCGDRSRRGIPNARKTLSSHRRWSA